MIRGLYNTAAALDVAAQNHDVVATNLAHASMPGYRRRTVSMESFEQTLTQAAAGTPNGATPATIGLKTHVVFEPGEIVSTGNPLDVALHGDGFFTLEGPNGPVYTRNGVFQLSGEGELQNTGGIPVSGTSGKITLPPGTAEITIRQDGTILADQTQVGQLQIAHFKDTSVLVPVGTTLFQAPSGVRPDDGTSTVHQHFRESSNVEVVSELVQMIAGMRQYEAAQRVMRAISDSIQQNTNPQAS